MQQSSFQYINPHMKVEELNPTSIKDPGVYSASYMSAAGFEYTGNGDTALCNDCTLEVSNWTLDMDPITIHSDRSPDCQFVRSRKISSLSGESASASLPTVSKRKMLTSSDTENISKRQKIPTMDSESPLNDDVCLADLLPIIRQRTFSHWPHRTIPSSDQMIEAGFFGCNVDDRVICIYCNLICQQWTDTDDPCEIHKTLSPECSFVKTKLIRPPTSPVIIINENLTEITSGNHSPSSNVQPVGCSEIVYSAAQNAIYFELTKRLESFDTWPRGNLSSIDDLVRAGFFYTGTKTIVSCFYCNGVLQNWGPTDNPMFEHARWFPHCAYAKQLCGDELHRKIQESKRPQQQHVSSNNSKLLIEDENDLSTLVADRLKLPMSQYLQKNFKLAIIERCWKDQLRLKGEDFVSGYDLLIACRILQKQIEHIDGNTENIIVPSIKMKQIREQNEARMRESILNTLPMTTDQDRTVPKSSNPCVLCFTEEKRLACLPCGHLTTCVPCGKSLQLCPTCRREIVALVRIYV